MSYLKWLSKARWIWCYDGGIGQNLCAIFRKEFFVQDLAEAKLLISADWDFLVWVNGEKIGGGQFPDYPDRKTVTEYSISNLVPGKNVIAVMVYAPGADFFSMAKGTPGVLLALHQNDRLLVASDTSWKAELAPHYSSGLADTVTPQLGFSMCLDMRKVEPFTDGGFDDSAWPDAVAAPRVCSLAMRPLPPIALGARLASKPVRSGKLFRKEEKETFAQTVAADLYDEAAVTANGCYHVFDLGAEVTGYADLDLENVPDGLTIDVSWGESLTDNRVRSLVGPRNFTIRIIGKAGRNRLEVPFLRMGCRYLQLNLVGQGGDLVQVRYAGLDDYSLVLPPPAKFDAGSPAAARLREVGLRTLQCCMHTHYEDCPWREQSLYGYDSRNQMLFGYYAWGNYDFARASLDLLGEGGSAATGEINICAPINELSGPGGVGSIPSFSRVWMRALQEYTLYSGDLSLAEKFVPQLEAMLTRYCRDFDETAGLFRLPEAPGVWNFFEWVPELDFPSQKVCDFHILHNLYTLEGIRACAQCFKLCGKTALCAQWTDFAEKLGKNIEAKFFLPASGCYASRLQGRSATGKLHTHVQILMLAMGLVPEARRAELGWKAVSDTSLVPLTFSPLLYFLKGLFDASPECRLAALAHIDREFLAMLDAGATTFWETEKGEYDFDHAGSLCHGWSCVHVGFYGKYILGVTPLEPGFRRFEVKPWPGNFDHASGEIPTPHGPIEVSWRKNANGRLVLEVTAPEGLTPELAAYPEAPVESCSHYTKVARK